MKKSILILLISFLSINLFSQVTPSGGITGSGTAGYIPKFTGGKKIGNSAIFQDGVNIGIGTVSPVVKLHVEGNIFTYGFRSGLVSVGNYSFWGSLTNEITTLFTGTGQHLILQYTGSGFVGVGTNAPTSVLHIKGVNGYSQFRLETQYTPTGSSDSNGLLGDISFDDNYFYIKVSTGWKRAALSSF